MRIPGLAIPRPWRAALLSACLGLLACAAGAQALPGGVALGMSPQELRQAQPVLVPVRHPPRLAGGLVGKWSGPGVDVAGVALAPTFFFADEQLERVEYLALAGAGAQAFDALLAWGRTAWGPELASRGPEGDYATWTTDALDVYLQHAGAGQVRLVIKRHVEKDASEL
jgi:hypothetical protein